MSGAGGKKSNLIFMGTPDFAVPSLQRLVESGYAITGVVTQPDRPKGRGRKLVASPVKTAAQHLKLPVMQPESVTADRFVGQLKQLKPDFIVVVAFGQILTQAILASSRMGAVNLHPSLLPRYRGPAPIQWALINGEKETGITTMFMDKGTDTGDLLLTETVAIEADDTSATLHDRLAQKGASLLDETIAALSAGRLIPVPQDESQATYAPLLKKSDGHINWDMPAEGVANLVRGMNPWPGAFTFYEKRRLKIFAAHPIPIAAMAPAGTIVAGFPDELRVATSQGILVIDEIQGASGKRLPISDFLRGFAMAPGTRFK
jgi:methionyl-tRNA formyltransferase